MRQDQLKEGITVKSKTLKRNVIIQSWNDSCVLIKSEKDRVLQTSKTGERLTQYNYGYLPMAFISDFEPIIEIPKENIK